MISVHMYKNVFKSWQIKETRKDVKCLNHNKKKSVSFSFEDDFPPGLEVKQYDKVHKTFEALLVFWRKHYIMPKNGKGA